MGGAAAWSLLLLLVAPVDNGTSVERGPLDGAKRLSLLVYVVGLSLLMPLLRVVTNVVCPDGDCRSLLVLRGADGDICFFELKQVGRCVRCTTKGKRRGAANERKRVLPSLRAPRFLISKRVCLDFL